VALIQCPECGGPVSDEAFACPHCGVPVQRDETGKEAEAPISTSTLEPCQHCGKDFDNSLNECPSCGRARSHTEEGFDGEGAAETFDVVLSSVSGSRSAVIEAVRRQTGWNHRLARYAARRCPAIILRGVTSARASEAVVALSGAGARAARYPSGVFNEKARSVRPSSAVPSFEETVLRERRSATRFVVSQMTMNAGAMLIGANLLWVGSVALGRVGIAVLLLGIVFQGLPESRTRVDSWWSVLWGGLLADALSRVGLPRVLAVAQSLAFILIVAGFAFGTP
jgi:ribosomal protein L7/L12